MSTLFPNLPKPKRRPRLTSQLRAVLGPDWRVRREGSVIHLDYQNGQHCPWVVVGLRAWTVRDGHGDTIVTINECEGVAALVARLRALVGQEAPGGEE
jgi:hypothetical protein